jgi:CheY-like chemotaxis protein
MNAREVVIVDDNPADALLMQTALESTADPRWQISIIGRSDTAVANLIARPTTPDLILLDYHMPTNGGMVLSELKRTPSLSHIPVIVVTGQVTERELCALYRNGASCCFVKPHSLDKHLGLFEGIASLWLREALLPKKC